MDLDGAILGSSLAGSFMALRLNDLRPNINVTADNIRVFFEISGRTKMNRSTTDLKRYYWAKFLTLQAYNRCFFRLVKRFFSWQGASKTTVQCLGVGLQIGRTVSIHPNNNACLEKGFEFPIPVDCLSLGNQLYHHNILCLLGLSNINKIYPGMNFEYTPKVFPYGEGPSSIFFGQIVDIVSQISFRQLNRILGNLKHNPIAIKLKDSLNEIVIQSNITRTPRRSYSKILKIDLMSFENKTAI